MNGTKLARVVGNRIGIIRYQKGDTQRELGEALGKSRTDINRWENGERSLSIENLKAIAEYYNVSADYFLGILPEGITEIRGDKRTAQQYTGLSNSALENLKSIKENCKPELLSTLNEILSNPNLTDVLNDVLRAAYILQIPNLPSVPKGKPFTESDTTFQVEEDGEDRFLMVRVDYRNASRYAKQSALESFGKIIDEVVGEEGNNHGYRTFKNKEKRWFSIL